MVGAAIICRFLWQQGGRVAGRLVCYATGAALPPLLELDDVGRAAGQGPRQVGAIKALQQKEAPARAAVQFCEGEDGNGQEEHATRTGNEGNEKKRKIIKEMR